MKKIMLLLVVLMLIGCNEDDIAADENGQIVKIGFIDKAFQTYVDNFINELNDRGLNLSSDALTVTFVDKITMPDSDRFCAYGYVNFQNSGNPRVEVINSNACWEKWSAIEKENLLFHELGHALLGYGHINATLPNGSQRSLMCASETCNNYRVYNRYQSEQRAYYLDQLASNSTTIPDWASEKVFSRTLYGDSFDNGIENWETLIGGDPNNEIPYIFYLSEEHTFSEPYALGIQATATSSTGAFGQWQRIYEISDFASCSNIAIQADISSENPIDGQVGIAVDLLARTADNELEYYARHTKTIGDLGIGEFRTENFEVRAICVPQETAAIRILLFINAPEDTRVTFDNLEVVLYE